MNSDIELSIVVPVYNGADTIARVVDQVSALHIDGGIEIILVNDGSNDNSAIICTNLVEVSATPIKFINLARNFGEHNAVMAGLWASSGRYIITIDDDLQHNPSDIAALHSHCRDNNLDVSYTFWDEKKHGLIRNLGSYLTNKMASIFMGKPEDIYFSTFRCMSRFLVTNILIHKGPYPYIDGLILQITDKIGKFKIIHNQREMGQSGYTTRKLIRLWLNIFVNYSVMPLRLSTIIGIVLSFLGLLYTIHVISLHMIYGTPAGWASIMSVVLLFSGAQLIVLGVMGEYLGRIHLTNNRKPQFIIRDTVVSNTKEKKK
jgi:undecaprenyl-phosphate 4-deoxy-4-formamido-L-arabinose transferase